MRILHLSDIHFGYEDGEAIAAVWKYVQANPPDVIVASGDISAAGLRTELEAAADWLSSLGPPVVVTPGNHDVPYLEVTARLWDPYRRFRRASEGRLLKSWRSPSTQIFTINTSRAIQLRLNWALGAISERHIRRTAKRLRAAPKDALKIVVTHHPLVFPPNAPLEGGTRGGPRAAKILTDAGAHLFLAGHLHVCSERSVIGDGNTAFAVVGGTLSQRLRGSPMAFVVLEHHADGRIAIERFDIENGEAKQTTVAVHRVGGDPVQ